MGSFQPKEGTMVLGSVSHKAVITWVMCPAPSLAVCTVAQVFTCMKTQDREGEEAMMAHMTIRKQRIVPPAGWSMATAVGAPNVGIACAATP